MSMIIPDSPDASAGTKRGFLQAAAVYLQRNMAAMAALGFASGLPLAIKGQVLQARMADAGMRPSEIGLFSLAGLPFVLKFLWAPLLDILPPPGIFARLGRRRGWLVLIQILLICAVFGLGLVDPHAAPWTVAALALCVAFAGANQDIMIDALRIERLSAQEQAAGLALYIAAYRMALLIAAAGTLGAVAALEGVGLDRDLAWRIGYAGLAALCGMGLVGVVLIGPDKQDLVYQTSTLSFRARLIEPMKTILSRPGVWTVLAFVALFKWGDGMADVMTLPFALSIGFDKATYAWAASGIGVGATLAGGFAAGIIERALGIWATLWLGALIQALVNLALVWLALEGSQVWALVIANSLTNAGHGFGAVVFVAFMSRLCTERAITATHYALLSALAALGRTIMVGPAGFIAEALGWPGFFLFTLLACVPGIVLLGVLYRGRDRNPDGAN
jgi:PAT family beta-lactamase induction signal transducer AmpG